MIEEIETGDKAVAHRPDGEIAIEVLLGLEHPVPAIGRELVVPGDIVIGKQIKIGAGAIRVAAGHRYIGLRTPLAIESVPHLAEEIGILRYLAQIPAYITARIIDGQLIRPGYAHGGDGLTIRNKENGVAQALAAVDLGVDQKGKPVAGLIA